MIEKLTYKWISLVSLLLSAVPIYLLATITKGNFLAGPVTVIFFCMPLVILQVFIVIKVWMNSSHKRKSYLTLTSVLALFFELYLLYGYINNIS